MMQMKPDEIRQLRVWAVEAALGKASMDKALYESGNTRSETCPRTITEVLADARKIVAFVRSSR